MNRWILVPLCLILALAEPARAYLDPGSGSMMLQLVLAGFAGFFMVVKLFWTRLLCRLGFRKKDGVQ